MPKRASKKEQLRFHTFRHPTILPIFLHSYPCYIPLCIYVYMYICIYVYMYICMYKYIPYVKYLTQIQYFRDFQGISSHNFQHLAVSWAPPPPAVRLRSRHLRRRPRTARRSCGSFPRSLGTEDVVKLCKTMYYLSYTIVQTLLCNIN